VPRGRYHRAGFWHGVLGEVRIHQRIYARRPDVGAICRIMPPILMSLSVLRITPGRDMASVLILRLDHHCGTTRVCCVTTSERRSLSS
jgi:HCOMODA/2-hydroxy-3-carboxy-muconic semialdehyde decarboxylase